MSISGVDLYNSRFKTLFFDSHKCSTPYCYRCPVGKQKENCSVECLSSMEDLLKEKASEISAIIIEPLLMGAGGMIIYPVEYLKGVSALAKKYNVHLIVDEVATGFGRTGKMFASEHGNIKPDFMCLSKGITSGYLPMGATLTTDEVYKAFYSDYEKKKTFYHGHTFTANPITAQTAVASIELFEKEKTLDKVPGIENRIRIFLDSVSDFGIVGDVRNIGVVGAIELVEDKKTKEPFGLKERIGLDIYKMGLKNNLLLRPLENIIYFFFPLCLTDKDLDYIFDRTFSILECIENKYSKEKVSL